MNLLHFLRAMRLRLAARLMQKALGSPPDRYAVFWKPAWIPMLILLVIAGAGVLVMASESIVADALWGAWSFFRFEEVFRFQLPGRPVFDIIARTGLGALLLLYAGPAVLRQLRALRSYVLIRKSDGAVHLVESGIFRRRITVLLPADIAGTALRENLFFRLINTADLTVDTRSGKEITVSSLFDARSAFQMIEDARTGK